MPGLTKKTWGARKSLGLDKNGKLKTSPIEIKCSRPILSVNMLYLWQARNCCEAASNNILCHLFHMVKTIDFGWNLND